MQFIQTYCAVTATRTYAEISSSVLACVRCRLVGFLRNTELSTEYLWLAERIDQLRFNLH